MSAEGFVGPAPEPSTLILFAFGLMVLGTFSWKLQTGR
jgi:PEP-CTERM motif